MLRMSASADPPPPLVELVVEKCYSNRRGSVTVSMTSTRSATSSDDDEGGSVCSYCEDSQDLSPFNNQYDEDENDVDADATGIRDVNYVTRLDGYSATDGNVVLVEEFENGCNEEDNNNTTPFSRSRGGDDNDNASDCSSSSGYSSSSEMDDDDENDAYEELMAQMPLALIRKGTIISSMRPLNTTPNKPISSEAEESVVSKAAATASTSAPTSSSSSSAAETTTTSDCFGSSERREQLANCSLLSSDGYSSSACIPNKPISEATVPLSEPFLKPKEPGSPERQPQEPHSLSDNYVAEANDVCSDDEDSCSDGSCSDDDVDADQTSDPSDSEYEDTSTSYGDLVASMAELPLRRAPAAPVVLPPSIPQPHGQPPPQGDGKAGAVVSSAGQKSPSCSSDSSSDSSDWSDDESDDSEYDDLIAEMPVAVGRVAPSSVARRPSRNPRRSSLKKLHPVPLSMIPEVQEPADQLAMFQNIRADLEKVGRMITEKKDGEKFLQRAHILASINWLSPHVPGCVLDHLGKEIRHLWEKKETKHKPAFQDPGRMMASVDIPVGNCDDDSVSSDISDTDHLDAVLERPRHRSPNRRRNIMQRRLSYRSTMMRTAAGCDDEYNLPFMTYFEGAVLFVDISGFTKLSTMLDPENLSKAINSYFQQILDKIFEFGGDVQKYAGDAVFAEWRSSSTSSIDQCVAAAAACSLALVRDCANFPVLEFAGSIGDGSTLASLNVHCGLGVGDMCGFHVGDNIRRREYLSLGDPITQATGACDRAELGQVVVSPEARAVLERLKLVKDDADDPQEDGFFVLGGRRFENVEMDRMACSTEKRNAKTRGITHHVEGLHVDALKEYRRLMSLYAHPVVVSNDVAAANDFKSSRRTGNEEDRRREDAELRSVYTMFINPEVVLEFSGSTEVDRESIELINEIMKLVTMLLSQHVGHLRQCIVDDKGLVLIATFGLRGSTFPNMVSERALPATFAISNALRAELNVNSKIGATFGDLYCGAVGGDKRHEYAVMGPSCNLAARLMSSEKNPGILVDNAVRRIAAQAYCFNALDPVKAKGYPEPVPIFEPLAPVLRSWGRIEANFVGRKDEIMRMAGLAREIIRTEFAPSKIVLISGANGMGKSTLLVHSIEHIRRMFLNSKRRLVIAKHVARECDTLAPFSSIRPILAKVLSSFVTVSDDGTLVSGLSSFNGGWSLAFDSLSGYSTADLTEVPEKEAMVAFDEICAELDPPESFITYAKHYLFGTDIPEASGKDFKVPPLRSLASFISHIFARCCDECKLCLVAIDSIHLADEMSWLVMKQMFETSNNVMFVGTTHVQADISARVEKHFWLSLNNEYARALRFIEMKVNKLTNDEVVDMTMKTLGIQRHEIAPELLTEILGQSGCSPHFANKILDGIRQRNATSEAEKIDTNSAVPEIVLHRIDSFDVSVRSVLNIASILGDFFAVEDIVAVQKEGGDNKNKIEDLYQQTMESLKFLKNEGILFAETIRESEKFSFNGEVWRSTVHRLMLSSRKRDIHKRIALSIEAENKTVAAISLDRWEKLFFHWKQAGIASKASDIALNIYEASKEDPSMPALEISTLCQESLRMWGWNAAHARSVGGFPPTLLNLIKALDLSKILSLLNAMGKTSSLCGMDLESIRAFKHILEIKRNAHAFSQLQDRSIVFDAYVSLYECITEQKSQQDTDGSFRQHLLREFMQETRSHGRAIHHIYALYLQMDLFAQLGEIDKAVAVQSLIKRIYKPEEHSVGLRKAYGRDAGAVSFSLCSLLQMASTDSRQALRTCQFVLKELFPSMVNLTTMQSFDIVYPLVFVLKEGGYGLEARNLFEKAVLTPLKNAPKRQKSSFLPAVEPLTTLLALSSQTEMPFDTIKEFLNRTSNLSDSRFDEQVNVRLCRLGRCADSLNAEICLLLAAKLPQGTVRESMIAQGKSIVESSKSFLDDHNLKFAKTQLEEIESKLQDLGIGLISKSEKTKKKKSVFGIQRRMSPPDQEFYASVAEL